MSSLTETIRIDIRDFTELSPQVQFLLVFQLIVLFILSILVGVMFSPRFKNAVQENETGSLLTTIPTESVRFNSLALIPQSEEMNVDETQRVDVIYNGESVDTLHMKIAYDPQVMQISEESIKIGGQTPEALSILNETDGVLEASWSAARPVEQVRKSRVNETVASFSVTALQSGAAELAIIQADVLDTPDNLDVPLETFSVTIDVLGDQIP